MLSFDNLSRDQISCFSWCTKLLPAVIAASSSRGILLPTLQRTTPSKPSKDIWSLDDDATHVPGYYVRRGLNGDGWFMLRDIRAIFARWCATTLKVWPPPRAFARRPTMRIFQGLSIVSSTGACMPNNAQLVTLLLKKAYKEGDFLLSSGARSDFYLDAKQVTYDPEGIALVGDMMVRLFGEFDIEAVGGLTMGADAIVAGTVFASAQSHRRIPGFVVRKEQKQHGLERQVEGVNPSGKRVAIVDDVITSGASVLKAIDAARSAGAMVVLVVGVVDREQGGAAAIQAYGVEFRALASISEIRRAARVAAGSVDAFV